MIDPRVFTDETFKKVYFDLRKAALEELRSNRNSEITDEEARAVISEVTEKKAQNGVNFGQYKEIMKNMVFSAMRGNDVLDELINDDSITEIMVNGYDSIFIERNGKIEKSGVRFFREKDLEDTIQRIVSQVNRSVNESHPIVDARLENGDRVNVVLPPASLIGPVLTIRKFNKEPLTIEYLIENGSLTKAAAAFLKELIETKHNIFISGGTGSGKTTTLNVLSNFIPKDERIITIEDSAELKLTNVENLVGLEKRNANDQDAGEITIRDLIKTSLRMRPDRIIVGEVRGAEAIDMLQAMNTGHDGSLSTGHANSAEDMLSRLETMVLLGAEIPLTAVRSQIASAVDFIVHISRMPDKSRKITEITEVIGYEDDNKGDPILNVIYMYDNKTNKLIRTKNPIQNTYKFVRNGKDASKW